MARIVVGMSGGVDSSAAAALLCDEGHEVVGVTLHLWDYARPDHAGRCCAPEDQRDARAVCDALGAAHYTFDRRELFRAAVVDRFVDEYRAGRTPSPCVACNESVKLGPLWSLARRLGADAIATGHYARIGVGDDGVCLRAAVDGARDQSYFLFAAPPAALRALRLPLGERTKSEVRAYVRDRGLPGADKPDSMDLCFLEGHGYADWLEARAPELARPGVFERADGSVVGTHGGVHRFTVGQRRGAGGDGRARVVLKLVPERGAVVVGTPDEAVADRAEVRDLRWLVDVAPERVTARLRYKHAGVGARVEARDAGRAVLHLDEPQRGVAPGQAAVLYVGDRVVGGAWIA